MQTETQKLSFTKSFILKHLIPAVYTQVILFLNWPYNTGSDKVMPQQTHTALSIY